MRPCRSTLWRRCSPAWHTPATGPRTSQCAARAAPGAGRGAASSSLRPGQRRGSSATPASSSAWCAPLSSPPAAPPAWCPALPGAGRLKLLHGPPLLAARLSCAAGRQGQPCPEQSRRAAAGKGVEKTLPCAVPAATFTLQSPRPVDNSRSGLLKCFLRREAPGPGGSEPRRWAGAVCRHDFFWGGVRACGRAGEWVGAAVPCHWLTPSRDTSPRIGAWGLNR